MVVSANDRLGHVTGSKLLNLTVCKLYVCNSEEAINDVKAN